MNFSFSKPRRGDGRTTRLILDFVTAWAPPRGTGEVMCFPPRPQGQQDSELPGVTKGPWEGKVHLSMPKAQASAGDLPQGGQCSLSSLQHQEQEGSDRSTLIHPGVWNPHFTMETCPHCWCPVSWKDHMGRVPASQAVKFRLLILLPSAESPRYVHKLAQ